MKTVVQHPLHGEIVCDESIWTGRKSVMFNGVPIAKTGKNTFQAPDGQIVTLNGNSMLGMSISVGTESKQIVPKVKWYEIVLSVIGFIFVMIWGNSVALCKIFPVIGGAIGGLISGGLGFLNLVLIRSVKPIWLKILISVGMLGATVLVCFLVALAILSLL